MNTRKKTARRWWAFRAAIDKHFSRHCATYSSILAIAGVWALTTCTVPAAHATIQAALKGAGARNTIIEVVQTPTTKRRFVMPEYLVERGASTPSRHGCGQDAPTRKGGGTASSVLRTSCPPYALRKAAGGFYPDSLEGAMTMTHHRKPSTTDALAAEVQQHINSAQQLLLSAQQALYQLKPQSPHAALGRTLSASRRLKQACGLLNTKGE